MCVLKIFKNLLYIDVVLVPLMGLFRYWRQCTEGGPDAAGDEDKPSEGKIWFISTEPAEDEDKPSEGKKWFFSTEPAEDEYKPSEGKKWFISTEPAEDGD